MYIGIADFADPTLLILGDVVSINWLADCIEMRQSIDLATLPFANLINMNLSISPTDSEGCLSRNDALFTWKIAPLEAQQFADQLRVLAARQESAHIYIDPKENNASVQILVSQGEYDEKAVFP